MEFNIKKFKSNILFFVISIVLIVVLSLLSFFASKSNSYYDKKDLNDSDIDINKLVLNEIMTSNKGAITDGNGKLYDYIEIYNGNNKDINLKNYGLSDENEKVKWVFGDTTIKAKSYLVVFLSGKSSELEAPFKLKSAGGEVVALLKPNGKAVDAIETVALEANNVMARDEKGSWVIQDKPTPGFSNNIEGHKKFLASLIDKEESGLIISEILADNKGNFKNENGLYSGYIEVKNTSKKSINLEGYSLSNSEDVCFKWQFPNYKLGSGEVVLVYTSGTSSVSGTLSTGFKLKSKTGSVILSNNSGKIIQKLDYDNLANGLALIEQNGAYLENNAISPGYDNTLDGIKSFEKKYLTYTKDLIINEVMNSNYSHLAQNGGRYYDWVELYNNSNSTIKLSDYCVTTNINTVCMYKLPNVELKKGEYYVFMASGDENLSNKKYKHAPFKIGSNDGIYVTKSNEIIDSIYIANIPKGYSMGKQGSYGHYYFSKPTPNKKNSSGTMAVSYTPKSDVASGIFNKSKSFKVTLNGYGNIYYTTDGSKPTTSSKKYSSPLTIKKTTVLRIMSKESGKLASDIQTYSYIVNENHTLPVISLAMNNSDFYYVNSHTSLNSPVMEEVNVELLELDGSGFQINAGLKLFGGSTRSYRKKSYEIKFKKKYGDGHLNYPVFDTVDSSVYNSLVLRTGSQDEFASDYDERIIIKDIVATSLMQKYTSVDVQAYKPVVMYVNGDYWGLYFLREKVDETFVSNHYNVATTKSDTDILRIDGEVKTGSNKNYLKMMNFIVNNSMSNSKNYNKIKDQIDIENFCDFWIAEIWANNYDIVNTRYFSNPNVDNGKWKWIYYDVDSGFYNVTGYGFNYYTRTQGVGYGNFSTALLRNLMKSSEFRKTFLERMSYNLKNTWSTKNFNGEIDRVLKEVGESEIKRNLSRWNNMSYSTFENHVSKVKKFASARNAYIIKEAKAYFGLSNSEVKKYFGDVK